MKLLSLDDAKDRLSAHQESVLVQPCQKAVKDWNSFVTTMPALAATISLTTRAGMVHDFTIAAVRAALTSGIREIPSYGFFVVVFADDLAVRYKYIADGQPRNLSTEKQGHLAKHQYGEELLDALALEGITSPPTLVTCGYTLSPDGQIRTLSVQCDYGKSVLWRFYVYGDPGIAGNFETLPIDPTDTLGTTVIRSTREKPASDRDAK